MDYWTSGERTPKQLVDLGGARCRRCPRPIEQVPRDKVDLVRDGRVYRRTFVCPHCRAVASDLIGREEALRLYAVGVPIARTRRRPDGSLTADEVARLADELRAADDLATRALDDAA
jgi:hypothetical protein